MAHWNAPAPVFLLGSADPESKPFALMLDRLFEATRGRRPRVAYSLAAAGPDVTLCRFARQLGPRAFRGASAERFTVRGEPGAMPAVQAQAIVARADLVFLSGGDPVLGARLLRDSGASVWLRRARSGGVALAGGSAGAILLGAWWADWSQGRPSLVACTEVVPDVVVDVHAERAGWPELDDLARLLRGRRRRLRFLGIPTRGAVVVSDERLEIVGRPVVFLGIA